VHDELAGRHHLQRGMTGLVVAHIERDQPRTFGQHRRGQNGQVLWISQPLIGFKCDPVGCRKHAQTPLHQQAKRRQRTGILPQLPDDVDTQQLARLQSYYKRLPARVREEIVEYAVFKYERSKNEQAPDD